MALTFQKRLDEVWDAPDAIAGICRFARLIEDVNGGKSEWCKQLLGEPVVTFLDRLFGEGRDSHSGLSNGLSHIIGARILAFEAASALLEKDKEGADAALAGFDAMERAKCAAALAVTNMLDVTAASYASGAHDFSKFAKAETLRALGMSDFGTSTALPPAARKSLFALSSPGLSSPLLSFPLRKEIAPLNTARILNATRGCAPARSMGSVGGLAGARQGQGWGAGTRETAEERWLREHEYSDDSCDKWKHIDPVLHLLIEEHVDKRMAGEGAGAGPDGGPAFLPEMPHVAELQKRNAATSTATTTQHRGTFHTSTLSRPKLASPKGTQNATSAAVEEPTTWPRELRVSLHELLLMYFAHWATSTSRRQLPTFPAHVIDDNRPIQDRTKTTRRAVEIILQAGGEGLPLAYRTDGQICGIHCYHDIVYQYCNTLLSMHETFPQYGTAPFFLACIKSYWLLHNPPTVAPLSPVLSTANGLGVKLGFPSELAGSPALSLSPSASAGSRGAFGTASPTLKSQKLLTQAGMDQASADPPDYKPPSEDQLKALTVVLLLQTCDSMYPNLISGREVPPSGGIELLTLARKLAESYTRNVPSPSCPDRIPKPVYDELRRSFPSAQSQSRTGGLSRSRTAALSSAPPELPGPRYMPIVWADLQFGLFTFIRTHLQKLSPVSQPWMYSMVVDLWITMMTPWRARDRHAGTIHVPTSQSRQFDYTRVTMQILGRRFPGHGEEIAAGPLSPHFVSGGGLRIPSSRSNYLHSLKVDGEELSRELRTQPEFEEAMRHAQDFASKLVWHPVWDDWRHYIALHYSFYTYMLRIFLQSISKTDLSATAPFFLLGGLERVCDVFEPCVVEQLRHVGVVASHMFGGDEVLQYSGASIDATRVQILAHLSLIDYPRQLSVKDLLLQVDDTFTDFTKITAQLRNARDAAPRPFVPAALERALEADAVVADMPDKPSLSRRISESAVSVAATVSTKWVSNTSEPITTLGMRVGRLVWWIGSILALVVNGALDFVGQTFRKHETVNFEYSEKGGDATGVVEDENGRQWPSPDRIQFLMDRICLITGKRACDKPRQLYPNPLRQRQAKRVEHNASWLWNFILHAIVRLVCYLTGLHASSETVVFADRANVKIERDRAGFLTPDTKRRLGRGEAYMASSGVMPVLPRSALPPGTHEFAWLVTATHNISDKLLSLLSTVLGRSFHYDPELLRAIERHSEFGPSASASTLYLKQTLSRPPNVLRILADWRWLSLFTLLLALFEGWVLSFNGTLLLIALSVQGLAVSVLAW